MAADLLLQLQQMQQLPGEYLILELSAELRLRQKETIAAKAPGLLDRVHWLDQLPEQSFEGVLLGNEVLDAMPVHRFRKAPSGIEEGRVVWRDDQLQLSWSETDNTRLQQAVTGLEESAGEFAVGYQSEINLRMAPWIQEITINMERGAVVLLDYGYEAAGYYHPERFEGTLICHYRHRAHDDVFFLPGLQDITANVDFSAVNQAGRNAGLNLSGYTTQANFLLGCGLDKLLAEVDPNDVAVYMDLIQGVKQLTLPGEMGERFKAIALIRGIEADLMGFNTRMLAL